MLRNFVNGTWVETGRTFANINPVNGEKVCEVSEADQATVARAVDAARAAMNGEWGRLSAAERAALLHKVADRIEARFDEFVDAEIADTGTPIRMRGPSIFRAEPRTFAFSPISSRVTPTKPTK